MIQTNKDHAIVAKNLTNPTIIQWLAEQNAHKVSIGQTHGIEYDTVIARHPVETTGNLMILRDGDFNRQHSWFKAGKPLREWDSGPFHMNNEVIMATWLCGKAGIEGITFLGFRAEDTIDSEFDRRQFREVMTQLIEEFDIGVRYTTSDSQLFQELGATEFNPENPLLEEDEEPKPVELPKMEDIFANQHLGVHARTGSVLRVSSDDMFGADVTIERDGKSPISFAVTEIVPEDVSYIDQNRLFLTNPAKSENVSRAVELFGNKYGIYLMNSNTKLQIHGIKREHDIDNISLPTTALLAFAMGGDFDEMQTRGVIENVGRKERQLLRGIAKNENITHV